MTTTTSPVSTEKYREDVSSSRDETGSTLSTSSGDSGKRRTDGRKSSKPKKLRLNSRDERDDVRQSPIFGMMSPRLPSTETPSLGQLTPRLTNESSGSSPLSQDLSSPPEHVIEPSLNSHSDDNIAVSDEEGELVIDQPVDFSNGGEKIKQTKPREPKPKRPKTKSLGSPNMPPSMMGTWEEQLAKLANAAQKSQIPNPISPNGDDIGEENRDPAQNSLKAATMGLDIAAQLKNHFLASLPTQGYNWLHGMGNVPPNTPQEMGKIKERTPLGGIK